MLPETIRKEYDAIRRISDFIHENPELGYKEFKAAAALKDFLKERGFSIREISAASRPRSWRNLIPRTPDRTSPCSVSSANTTRWRGSAMPAVTT